MEFHFPSDLTPAQNPLNMGEQFSYKTSKYCCIIGVSFSDMSLLT